MKKLLLIPVFIFAFIFANAQTRQMEYLDRGVVAVSTSDGVFISWRLLGTEDFKTAFNIYKNGKLLNNTPIDNVTNYTDKSGLLTDQYTVKKLEDRKEVETSKAVNTWEKP